MRSCVRRPRFARHAFGVARITSKSREKAAQKRQKATKTEHKNVGLYAQKTPHSAYWKILENATNALYCDFSLAYWTGFSILRNFPSILIYARSSILPWTPILRFFSSILCSDSLIFALYRLLFVGGINYISVLLKIGVWSFSCVLDILPLYPMPYSSHISA